MDEADPRAKLEPFQALLAEVVAVANEHGLDAGAVNMAQCEVCRNDDRAFPGQGAYAPTLTVDLSR